MSLDGAEARAKLRGTDVRRPCGPSFPWALGYLFAGLMRFGRTAQSLLLPMSGLEARTAVDLRGTQSAQGGMASGSSQASVRYPKQDGGAVTVTSSLGSTALETLDDTPDLC